MAFSIENITKISKEPVTVTDVTVLDTRTDEVTTHRFYRRGTVFPYKEIYNELAQRGYAILSTEGVDYTDGEIDWMAVYTDFIAKERSAG